MDIYITKRDLYLPGVTQYGDVVGLSKGRSDFSKSSADEMAPCWPHCLVVSRSGYRNVSKPWEAVTGD